MMFSFSKWAPAVLLLIALYSCNNAASNDGENTVPVTPVTVTTISKQPLTEYIELNATSSFLQKNYAKAVASGYIQSVNVQVGQFVNAGAVLFRLRSKEANSIGNTINKLDPSFKFSGVSVIKASRSGYVTQLNHQVGDYVQDGEPLATISDKSSFAFILSLPYELKRYANIGKHVSVILPDSTVLDGTISSELPTVDQASQTQNIVVKVPATNSIPENLVAKVRIMKTKLSEAVSLPKGAVLTNDIQSEFWVMKMIDSNTAVKVLVKKGLETNDRVEIDSPAFTSTDKILLVGNYGLPDTTKVKIVQE